MKYAIAATIDDREVLFRCSEETLKKRFGQNVALRTMRIYDDPGELAAYTNRPTTSMVAKQRGA